MVKNLSTVDRSEKVRIGKYMPNDQALNSIVLNATSNVIEAPNSGLYVAPIRKGGSSLSNALAYNSETHEIFDTGLTPETTLQGVMAFGNTTTLTAEFNNVATGLVTAANVGIANANPIHTLDIGSNVSIEDSGSNVLDVRGNVFVTQSTFITGNLHVLGDTTLVSKQNLIVDDGIVEIGKNNYDSLTATDLGFIMTRSPTEANVALGFTETDDVFILAHTQSSAGGDNLVPDTSNSISMRVYGNVVADSFAGDGGLLSNIASNLEQIVNNGNVSSNTIQLTNVTDGLVATGNVTASYFKGDGTHVTNVLHMNEFDIHAANIRDEMATNTVTMYSNLASNLATIRSEMVANTVTVRSDLQSNVGIIRGEMAANTVTLRSEMAANTVTMYSNLASNLATIRSEMAANTVTLRSDLQSNVGIIRSEMAANTVAMQSNLNSNVSRIATLESEGLSHIVDRNNVSSNTIRLTNATDGLVATGNVTAAYFKGDGRHLTGLVTTLQDVSDNGNVTDNTLRLTNATDGLVATGNVTAAYFKGDGSSLSNIASNLEQIVNNGNVSSNTVQFINTGTSLVTSGKVGVNQTTPQKTLHVGGEILADDDITGVDFFGQDATFTGDLSVSGDSLLYGNLEVRGNTTYLSTQNLLVEDPILALAADNTSSSLDTGVVLVYQGDSNVAFGYRGANSEFIISHTLSSPSDSTLIPDTSNVIDVHVYGNVTADGDITGDDFFGQDATFTSNVQAAHFKGDGTYVTNVLHMNEFDIHASNLRNEMAANTVTLRGEMTANTVTLRGEMAANTVTLRSEMAANTVTLRGEMAANTVTLRSEMAANTVTMYSNLASNLATIRSEMAANTVTMYSNLASNLATIRSEMAANTVTVRSDLQSNVGIIRGEMAANTVTMYSNLASNLATIRSEMAANTVAMQSNLNSNVSRIATLESEGLSHIVDRNNVSSNTIRLTNATDGLVATGNVTAAFFKGDGSKLTGLVTNLQDVSDNGNVTDNTLRLTNATDGLVATGNVTAAYFKGDGSELTGLVTDLESVIINGNNTSNIVEFHGPDVSIVTSNAVGVKNTNPQHDFSVGTNVFVDDVASNILTVDGNILAHAITLDSINLSAGLGLEKVIIFGNATSNVVEFNNATGFVTSSNVGIANASATHTMDIGSNVFIDDVGSNVLYVRGNIYSDIVTTPKLGVSNNAPTKDLSVGSNLYVDEYGSNVLVIGGNVSMGTKLSLGSIDLSVGQTLDNVVNVSNVTDNVIQLTNVTDGLVATGNVTAAYFKGVGTELTGVALNTDISTIRTEMAANTVTLRNEMAANTVTLRTEMAANTVTLRSEMAANTVAMQSNLSDNSSRITALESSPMSIAGVKTFTSDVILEANLKVNGDLTYANTVNLIVSDPIMELGANNQHVGDLGIVMVRHDGSESNVSMSYDEDDDILRFGYTDDSAHGTTIANTSDKLNVSITGNVAAAYDTNTTSYFGRAAVGYMGQSDQASFSHIDKNTSANFALKQAASGATHINTPTGQHIRFSVNASEVGRFSGGGDFKVGNNPVKFYVDTAASEVQMYSQATGSTAGPDLVLMRDNPNNGGNNEYIGQIRYEGLNNNGNSLLYAKTTGKIKTATNNSEDGVIETMIKTGGSNRISVRHSGDKFLITNGTDLQVGEVANLYVDTSTSRVGIGTPSPIAALDIDGGANNDTTPALAIRGGIHTESDLYVLNSYSVNTGVGYAAKVIGVNINNKVETDNTIQIRSNTGGLTSAGAIYLGSDDVSQGIFGVLGGTGTAGSTLSEYLTVRANGNVGIGTTSPNGNLHIMSDLANASSQINPSGQLVLHSSLAGLDDNGDIGASLVFTQRWLDSSPNSHGTMGSIHGFKDTSAGNYGGGLLFKTQPGYDTTPVERMRIDKDGNVGIGTTGPRGMLDVYTGSTSTAGLIIDRAPSGTHRSELYQESDGLAIKVGDGTNAPTENMRITSSTIATAGKLTVGTSTASGSQLFVYGAGNGTSTVNTDFHVIPNGQMYLYGTRPWITTTNSAGQYDRQCCLVHHVTGHQPAIEWLRNPGQGTNQKNWLLRQENDDYLDLWFYNGSSWSVPFAFHKDGNLGLGTSSPRQKLEINNGHVAIVSPSWKTTTDDYQLAGAINFHLGGNAGEQATPVAAIEAYDRYTPSNGYGGALAIKIHGTERFRLDRDGTMRHWGLTLTPGTNVDQIKTINKSLQLSTSWSATGIQGGDLASGTYIVQVYSNDWPNGGGNYEEKSSGIMSWHSTGTNSYESHDITLHAAGHAPNSMSIALRVTRNPNAGVGYCQLQMRKLSGTMTSAYNYTFRFRRMI